MAPPSHLPSLAEQGQLIGDLRSLISARGFVPFVSAPILEPSPAHFPDRWRPDALGVERLARRLLGYAGLAELDVDVELYAADVKVRRLGQYGNATATTHRGAAAWFAGIVEGRCLFGAAADGLAAPDRLAGVMAHEVAHAYRHRHHLDLRDRDVDEPLTDLTTIYLGFGVLTTNASYRYRASGELAGAYTRTRWSHDQGGYLSPQAMSFLLAAQVVVRHLPAGERRRLAGMLEPNQAAYFKAACAALDRATLIERLGLPPEEEWPTVVAPAPQAFATKDDPPLPDPIALAQDHRRHRNQGLPVFRVGITAAWRYTFLAFPVAAAGYIALGVVTGSWLAALVLPVAALVAGYKFGKRRAQDLCSELDCAATIPAAAETCPGCGGTVAGRIRHADERLEAREALEGTAGDEDGEEGDPEELDADESVR